MPIKAVFKKKPKFDYSKSRNCLSCENEFQGRFCNVCGEKVVEPHERSLKEIMDQVLSSFTFVDNKLIRSLRAITMYPGQMSDDFSKGKRIGYMKPVALFLVGNLIYFLFPIFETFNTKLYVQINFSPYADLMNIEERTNQKIAELELSYEEFETLYNNRSTTVSKTILISIIPIFSVFVVLIFGLTYRYYFDHLLFSIEFFTYSLFVSVIGLSIIILILQAFLTPIIGFQFFNDSFVTIILVITSNYFFIKAVRRFYNLSWTKSSLSLLPLSIATALSVTIYRLLLFEVTMLTL